VLVLDEPTANLDYGNKLRVLQESSGCAARAARSSCRHTIPIMLSRTPTERSC
jgi:ABC-type cobalamin/Fe3+-siderophores transport system ATPase subunit